MTILAVALATWSTSAAAGAVDDACVLNGIKLAGAVEVVDSFPDFKVQVVTSFPDLKVMMVDSFADECGEWKRVDAFPDFRIQFVESFSDLKIQYVNSFPGVP
ncbi:MAG: hypothetical protein GC152_00730 [Alphaproteobacteria bacterium]|nr:hypothetical protein [Alphaproteobacteria bacterium]